MPTTTRTIEAKRANGTKRTFVECNTETWNGDRCSFTGKEVLEGNELGPSTTFNLNFRQFESIEGRDVTQTP